MKRLVCGYDVSGTIENLADGQVKLVAGGQAGELKELMQAVRDSGMGPMIRDEQVSWSEAIGDFVGFEIVR